MTLSQMKSLLQKNQITPNKLLGQNFMVDFSVFPQLTRHANLNGSDVVLDAGAGFGFLSRFLSDKCHAVVAVEKDPKIAAVLKTQLQNTPNITVIEGDVLRAELPVFNKAVSIPPYYLSSQLLTWLLDHNLDCAVFIVQKEFADRLVASVGSEQYGWLRVVTYQAANAELLDEVPRWMFYPEPEVDSVIVRLTPWQTLPFAVRDTGVFRRLSKWLFTQRNKKLSNALVPFLRNERKLDKTQAEAVVAKIELPPKRARDLSPQDFGALSDALCS
ncbi:MAG: 16S rRNA (adenine(1518)-N(6)/adenine(1519)-N(6))-dimethyltransferase RsmA [Candidatus Bathyarchaeota archaeon]|nr:16S rRNA (adenine(1518)-N(6)/adenine(1519)-N(6))-dimethyltransferase RsmA [Candidatus Bathyarchaeota archaeon]